MFHSAIKMSSCFHTSLLSFSSPYLMTTIPHQAVPQLGDDSAAHDMDLGHTAMCAQHDTSSYAQCYPDRDRAE